MFLFNLEKMKIQFMLKNKEWCIDEYIYGTCVSVYFNDYEFQHLFFCSIYTENDFCRQYLLKWYVTVLRLIIK